MWDASSWMRKLLLAWVAPVFTGSSFRLFALSQHRVGVVLVSAVATISSAASLTLKAARVYWCQLEQSAASPAPSSGVPFCLVHKSCPWLMIPCHRFGDLGCPGVQWCTCSWLGAEAHSLVPGWAPWLVCPLWFSCCPKGKRVSALLPLPGCSSSQGVLLHSNMENAKPGAFTRTFWKFSLPSLLGYEKMVFVEVAWFVCVGSWWLDE